MLHGELECCTWLVFNYRMYDALRIATSNSTVVVKILTK